MPTIDPNTQVTFVGQALTRIKYAPPLGTYVIAVEQSALRSPRNALTTVVAMENEAILWAGSVDEGMLAPQGKATVAARESLTALLLTGPRLWQVIRPGSLRTQGPAIQDTLYQGDRPWLVVGELANQALLAVALNDIGPGTRGHYQHEVRQADLEFPGSKHSKVELNHIWSFPSALPGIGQLSVAARPAAQAALLGYYPGRQ